MHDRHVVQRAVHGAVGGAFQFERAVAVGEPEIVRGGAVGVFDHGRGLVHGAAADGAMQEAQIGALGL